MKRYPFKFLDAYTRKDRDIFFGREEELDQLYQMVFQTDLLLVYGASGTGKTSLIMCGLASRFQPYEWLALFVRRGNNLNESLEKTLAEAGGAAANSAPGGLHWLDEPDEPAEAPLSRVAQQLKAVYETHFKPVYLIFDQFEELYILGSREEQLAFMDTVRDILRLEQPVKIILSIREEYLGYLYEFERKVPELLRKKLRVEPMNLEKVSAVVKSIGQLPQGNVRLLAGEEEAIAEGIFEKLKGRENTRTIELPYLQVFLDKLYLQISGDRQRQAEALFSVAELQKTGNIGDVLREFLDEQVLHTAAELQTQPDEIWKTLSPFVTLEGTKEPLSAEMLQERLPNTPPAFVRSCLQAFQNSRILRFDEKDQRYEIAHDSLARQVHAKRSDEEIALLEVRRLIHSQAVMKPEAREFFTEKQLAFMTPYLPQLKLSKEELDWMEQSRAHLQEQKEARERQQQAELEKARQQAEQEKSLRRRAEGNEQRARQRTRLAALLAFLALLVAGWAYLLQNKAQQLTQQTNVQKTEIQKNVKDLEYKEKALQISLSAAREAKDTAEARRLEAELATTRAELKEGQAQSALIELAKSNIGVVNLILVNAQRDLLNLRYEDALDKIKAAGRLGAMKREVAKHYLEIAFWHGEAGNIQRARGILDTASALVGNTAVPRLLKQIPAQAPAARERLREAYKALDAAAFKELFESKYYPELVFVQGGVFEMGCDSVAAKAVLGDDFSCGENEQLHPQELSSFYMAKYETTVRQFALYCYAKGLDMKDHLEATWSEPADNPVVHVSWFDALLYLNWLNQQHAIAPVYELGNKREGTFGDYYDEVSFRPGTKGFRLPIEAEWEYAARGGTDRAPYIFAGSNEAEEVAWIDANSDGRTHPVSAKKGNALGLHDMSGNAWEWCWDWYGDYEQKPPKDYSGPASGSYRVLRGGSWGNDAGYCRTAYRRSHQPDDRHSNVGFRLVSFP